MGVMGKIFEFLGFENNEKESKHKPKKEKKVKASYNFKKKQRVEKIDNIDGVSVVYPEIYDDAEKILEAIRGEEPVIVSIEYCDKNDVEKVVAYITGASKMVGGDVRVLEKGRYYIFLPEGVDLEDWFKSKLQKNNFYYISNYDSNACAWFAYQVFY